ncbi:MAG TPA: PKD domain-containing protein, partial [Myxococcales bacterium]|nr:PKD domain-containing protein [Myxococcales bacterium]
MQVRLTPMSFDASASSDPDGDALSYTWDFGDGERGGSASLAHAFSAAGSFTVKLTVADGRGGVSTAQHTVTVSALTHGAAVIVNGIVEDVAGPLSGVSIQDVGGASVTSDAAGRVAISLSVGIAHTLKLSKAGYADQFQPMSLDAAATNGLFRVVMLAREAAQNLDAAAGGNLSGKHGAKITLPAGSLQDASGVAVTGAIQITQTPVDISSNMKGTFPGTFTGVTADGAQTPIASYGSTEFALSKNGQKLQLAPGKTAAIELPIYASQHLTGTNIAAGDQIPLWSLSEKTGLWVQEGHGTVVASSASPSGFALQAQVSHFSWWNGDAPERGGYKPKPRCFLNPGPEFLPIPIPCTIGPPLPGEFSVVTPVKQGLTTFFGVPYYALRIDIPINGGVQVPIPQDIDFPLNACALSNNLFFCGSLTVHGANGVSDEPHILLNPLAPAGTCGSPTAITLPLQQQAFAINSADQASCLHFSAVAGQFLSLSIAQVAGSSLSGSLQLTGPAGQILGTASFGTGRAGSMTIVTPTAGDYGIKIGADSGVPGGFVLSASLETPQQIAVPSTAVYQVDAVTGVKRFVLDAAAGDVVAVSARASGPNGGSPGTITSAVDGTTSSFLGSGYGPVTFRPTISGSYGFTVQTNRSNGRDVLVTVSKAQSLDVGATGTGAVPKDGTVTSFAFQGTAGTLIAAAISTESLNQNNANLCPRPMRVFDPAGVELTPPSSGSVLQLGPVALTSSGKYRLDLFAPIGFGCDAESVR